MPVVKNERKKLFCMSCGKNVDSGSFYVGKNPKYKYWGNIPICKDCMLEMYNELYQENPDHRIAVIKFCIAMDIPFADNIFNMAMNRFTKEKYPIPVGYMSFINSAVGKNKGKRFQDGELFDQLLCSGSGEDSLRAENSVLDKQLGELQEKYDSLFKDYNKTVTERERLLKEKNDLLGKIENIGSTKSSSKKNTQDDSEEDCESDEEEKIYDPFWVGSYTELELETLNNYYKDLQTDYKIVTVNHKDYAKKIAKASLAMDRAFEDMLKTGNDSLYKSARDTFDKLSQSAKFAENQRGLNDVSLGSYGVMADRVENNTWIPEYEPEDKDMYDKLLAQFANISRSL